MYTCVCARKYCVGLFELFGMAQAPICMFLVVCAGGGGGEDGLDRERMGLCACLCVHMLV